MKFELVPFEVNFLKREGTVSILCTVFLKTI